jgi:predicted TIM-barrel fold metal-dependent hydrolase
MEMDEAGIDVQVLSLTSPGVEQLDASAAVDLALDANDYLADAVQLHPTRFLGLATLPTAAPDTATHQLERMVTTPPPQSVIKASYIGNYSR